MQRAVYSNSLKDIVCILIGSEGRHIFEISKSPRKRNLKKKANGVKIKAIELYLFI